MDAADIRCSLLQCAAACAASACACLCLTLFSIAVWLSSGDAPTNAVVPFAPKRADDDVAAVPLPRARPGDAASVPDARWGLRRIQNGEPVRIAAAGLSRSGSTWQFIMLTLLLEAVVEQHSPLGLAEREVVTAFGKVQESFDVCLAQRYCVAKSHAMLPDVLFRVDAVFVSHRDVRTLLQSTARFFSSCLYYGTQPVAPFFAHYAAWLPHACYDMQYEAHQKEGDAVSIQRHARQLGVPCSEELAREIAHRIAKLTHGGGGGGKDGGGGGEGGDSRPGSMSLQEQRDARRDFALAKDADGTTPTHMTSDPSNPLQARGVVGRREAAVALHCPRDEERRLVEAGWGRWLVHKGYARDDAEAARLRDGGNGFVEALAQQAVLMGDQPLGWAESQGACPRRSGWAAELDSAHTWAYSLLRVNRSEGAPHSAANIGVAPAGWTDVEAAVHVLGMYAAQTVLVPLIDGLPQLLCGCVGCCIGLGACLQLHRQRRRRQHHGRAWHKKSDNGGAAV